MANESNSKRKKRPHKHTSCAHMVLILLFWCLLRQYENCHTIAASCIHAMIAGIKPLSQQFDFNLTLFFLFARMWFLFFGGWHFIYVAADSLTHFHQHSNSKRWQKTGNTVIYYIIIIHTSVDYVQTRFSHIILSHRVAFGIANGKLVIEFT